MTETGIKTELTYFFRLFQKKLCQWSKKNNFLQQPHDHLAFSDDEGIYCFSDGGSWPVNKASLRYEMNTEAQTGRAIPICFVLKSDEVCSPIARSFPAACDDVWVSPGLVIPNAFCALNASSVLLHMPVAGAHGRLTNGYATARTPLFQSWLIVVHCAVRWKVWLLMLGENLKRKTCALAKKWLFFFFKKTNVFRADDRSDRYVACPPSGATISLPHYHARPFRQWWRCIFVGTHTNTQEPFTDCRDGVVFRRFIPVAVFADLNPGWRRASHARFDVSGKWNGIAKVAAFGPGRHRAPAPNNARRNLRDKHL